MVRDATRCLKGKAPIFGLRLMVQPQPPPGSQEDPTMPYLRLDLPKTSISNQTGPRGSPVPSLRGRDADAVVASQCGDRGAW
jgi:hypothetical protein